LIQPPEVVAEIQNTPRFNKKLSYLLRKKKEKNEDKIYLNELLDLSREASAEEEAEAKRKKDNRNR